MPIYNYISNFSYRNRREKNNTSIMKSRWFLVLVVLFIWLNTGYGAAIGQEVCNCQPSLIRTPTISVPTPGFRIVCTKTPDPQQYTPISNACSCVNTRVTPAPIAMVDCDLTATTPTPQASGAGADKDPQPFGERGGAFFPPAASACDAAAGGPGPAAASQDDPPGPDGIDEPAAGDACGCGAAAAVDPVSLMLAQAEANRCRGDVREGRLAFGPAAVPRDAAPPSAPAGPDVDEEGLYALDKAVVELRTCKRYGQQAAAAALASDTDALLALEEDALPADADDAGPAAVALPSYADVGYRPETPSCAPLTAGGPVPPPAACPRPTVVYDGTACGGGGAAPQPPPPVAAYSPRYCSGGGSAAAASQMYRCSGGGKCSGGVGCSCGGKCSRAGKCSCAGKCSY